MKKKELPTRHWRWRYWEALTRRGDISIVLDCSICAPHFESQSSKTFLPSSNDSHFSACKNRQLWSCWLGSALAAFRKTLTRSFDVLLESVNHTTMRVMRMLFSDHDGFRKFHIRFAVYSSSIVNKMQKNARTTLMLQIFRKIFSKLVYARFKKVDPVRKLG